MKFGVMLPHRWIYASKRSIIEFAKLAEDLGFSSLWVTDHIIVPPYRKERGHIFYEPLITLAFVGAQTGLDLGTCVLILSARNPILLAKQAATLDLLSQGRLILGVGAGWIEEEIEAMGSSYKLRGKMEDEAIELLNTLWSEKGPISFDGRFWKFENMIFEPKPSRKIPIWVGGKKKPSIIRATKLGDGWIPWAISPEDLEKGVRFIEKTSRKRIEIAVVTPVNMVKGASNTYGGSLGERHWFLAGSTEEVLRGVERLVEAGCNHLICSFRDVRLFRDDNISIMAEQAKAFSRGVMPSFTS
ncbi:MAG TPA: LLM class flavin-dependent oxidoreductase [Candidatus Korarchaeota archaeon]|nr:LLM class flavin-dependent oxidoreductase [Candidatus Korarchaeota archaeon]